MSTAQPLPTPQEEKPKRSKRREVVIHSVLEQSNWQPY